MLKFKRGSILMEGVLVLPLWVIVFGGVMTLGLRGRDVLRLKVSERYAAEDAVARKGAKGPLLPLVTTDPFRGVGIATTAQGRWVAKSVAEKAKQKKAYPYVMLVGGKSTMRGEAATPIFADMLAQPLYGIEKDSASFLESLTTSRKGKPYTTYMIVRTKASNDVRRHWASGLVYMKDVWQYEDKADGDNTYPEKWTAEEDGGKMAAFADPDMADRVTADRYAKMYRDDGQVYERYDAFVDWSGKAEDK